MRVLSGGGFVFLGRVEGYSQVVLVHGSNWSGVVDVTPDTEIDERPAAASESIMANVLIIGLIGSLR